MVARDRISCVRFHSDQNNGPECTGKLYFCGVCYTRIHIHLLSMQN
jgi:hypothetical protein